jgi:hypothetical protein
LNGIRERPGKIAASIGFRSRKQSLFGDPFAATYPDPDHSEMEHRFITVGMSNANRVLLVVHADGRENIRIVTARRATPRERENYEEEN